MRLAEAIKNLRVELGLSQRELAEKFGVNRATVVRWENDGSFPKQGVTDRIREEVSHMIITEKCRDSLLKALEAGRRRGEPASEIGFPDIDRELLCQMVEDSANAVYAIEADTYRLIYANQKSDELSKYDFRRTRGKTCYEAMMHKDQPCKGCPMEKLHGYEFREDIVKHFQDERYLRVRGRKFRWNGKDIYIAYVSNVTELIREKEAVRAFIDSLPIGAGTYRLYQDGSLEQVYMNDGFYEMMGVERKYSFIKPGFTRLQAVHMEDRAKLRVALHNIIRNPMQGIEHIYRVNAGNGVFREIMMRGNIVEKNQSYYTINCNFIEVDRIMGMRRK